MIYVGIDVAKYKHDCYICNSDGEALIEPFTTENNYEGFDLLFQRIKSTTKDLTEVRVGLEATGHYSCNLLGYLLNKDLLIFFLNPYQVKTYKKGSTLRKTKTDKLDAKLIASMIRDKKDIKPYPKQSYYNKELKSLTRYRHKIVKERAILKTSSSRLVCILFPELKKLVSKCHLTSIYTLLLEFPGADAIANAHITRLTNILSEGSRGKFKKEDAILMRDTARRSIGTISEAISLELKHTIKRIQDLDKTIDEIEEKIQKIVDDIGSPITTIPGITFRMGSMIIAEIGDFNRFENADKICAYAGMSPSFDESGEKENRHAHMEKRGSRHLRYALYNATKYVCKWDKTFKAYFNKKLAEGKPYNVAISHAAKKLVRTIYALEMSHQRYTPAH